MSTTQYPSSSRERPGRPRIYTVAIRRRGDDPAYAEPRIERVGATTHERAIARLARQGRLDPRTEEVVGTTAEEAW